MNFSDPRKSPLRRASPPPPPNTALQRTRVRPAGGRSPLSFETLDALWLGLVLSFAPILGAAAPPPSLEAVREALHRAAGGNYAVAESLGITVAGWNRSQEISLRSSTLCSASPGSAATAILISRHLGGELLVFDVAGHLGAFMSINEPVTYEFRDLNGDGLMEISVEEVDGYGTGVHETGYHIYAFDTSTPREIWQAPAMWSWSNRDPESGRGLLRFEWRWGKPGPLVLYSADGIRDGKVVRKREAWEYLDGKLRRHPFPKTPGV